MRMCFNQLKAFNRISPFTGLSVHISPKHCFDFKLKTNEPSSPVVCQLLKRVNILLTLCFPLLIRLFQLPFLTLPIDRRYINTDVGCFALLGDFSAEMGYYFYAPSSTFHRLVGWVNNGCYRRVYRVQAALQSAWACAFLYSVESVTR